MAGTDAANLRTWWGGPLDVEGLALAAVGAAATALDRYTGAAGRYSASPELTAAAFDSSGHLRIAGRPLQGFAPLSGFRRTRDGWIRLHANYPHHRQRLLQALNATTAEEAEAALRIMDSLEAESVIQARGAVAAAVRTRAEWQASEMGRAAAAGPWMVLDPQAPDGPAAGAAMEGSGRRGIPQPGGDPRRPLLGVRVLDLTRVIAGPVSTRLLAALGADVLRIDPTALPELSDQFVDTSFGKRSAVADLGRPGTRAALERLVAGADIVITGYRTGSLDRFGLDAASLLSARPDLAVVTLNSWGTDGPWSSLRGFDSIVQAASGIAHLYGTTDDAGWRPGALPVQALDHATGYGAAAAAVTLLARRQESGAGGSARLSLARTAEELFRLPPGPRGLPALPPPEYRTMASSYGGLRYVRPPLLVEGQALDYPGPPPPYASSALDWVPRSD
ncbi:L-carnitine dehydratase/bile acid-inducible protein F [Pseudarthrobacter chlorophenolicus A6]|uniref:L-carnitine dehydratase/bile acid-inducible protein F n=1 Tax=Pseudarthrobacter chlorophenolicus (strain ATCC 700700 / DSM 12829 / CIP 107037 / JCM 12360 / KCTC 9906 / NCIMB 13794 / A6) TaxID=452863 RepID=B8HB58_PSECP|nr:CoA transferase [Pseudarthrobacter chlorophenolicus]ACL38543.1 L-carnitine dehydratase/bile acid-inducible protein F [Pseudarthrobacter chlorophenolicus A6]SDQ46510.1 CoA-transferase family III [Pseudarthrobacter chlorophenolicus]